MDTFILTLMFTSGYQQMFQYRLNYYHLQGYELMQSK